MLSTEEYDLEVYDCRVTIRGIPSLVTRISSKSASPTFGKHVRQLLLLKTSVGALAAGKSVMTKDYICGAYCSIPLCLSIKDSQRHCILTGLPFQTLRLRDTCLIM
ncbi:hypothetical protein Plhal304r1_c077g0164211 [Plasmopara halstedii]